MFYSTVRFLANIYLNIYYRFEVIGRENVPEGVAVILAPNHIHWADPIVIACKVTAQTISFMGKQELFRNPALKWLLTKLTVIPVRRGEADVTAVKSALRVLKNNGILGIFPEGTRVKQGEEKPPEAGFVVLAIKSKCGILPVSIEGNYKFRSTIRIVIGKPIDLSPYYGKKNDRETLEDIGLKLMKEIKELGTTR
ncbi:1-acyl-sn-glycerol-3-phosphate acyltransferase [Alkalibacter rhizosphaerae]|uniref:1-acyl-sn-glycerol-3-phosphate acyltransferase n=1 Tax=Alkalibacter rhizosphaerae TaxID=2815577 RepID=A0A974XFS4_9FIRM|nr:lysophospholipid acyltransferase family protein [Alkalibacter rhizosphaerae]QSX08901.1 1-acyl-sn-glycerol-3-phosphate acyltransferase [Alkalibacter rhizosphaerae]